MELTQWGSTYDALFYYLIGDIQRAYTILYNEGRTRCRTDRSLEAIPSIEAIDAFCLEAERLIAQDTEEIAVPVLGSITSAAPADSGETSDHQGQEQGH